MLIWINILVAGIAIGMETQSIPYGVAVVCGLQSIMAGLNELGRN